MHGGCWPLPTWSPLLALLALLCCPLARADRGTEQVALAASGRYDMLEQLLEAQQAKGPLDTRDRHALCYAYSKTKRYARLMACLSLLASNLQRGDKPTRLFALDDATPALGLMRSEAQLELGQYASAAATARATGEWLAADRSDDLDMVFNAIAAEAMALTFAGERERAVLLAGRLAGLGTGTMGAYASAKAMALARVRMALGDYAGVLAAFDSDKLFAVNVFQQDTDPAGCLGNGVQTDRRQLPLPARGRARRVRRRHALAVAPGAGRRWQQRRLADRRRGVRIAPERRPGDAVGLRNGAGQGHER